MSDPAHEIEQAFADAVYPGDDNIAYDQSGRHLECMQVFAAFRGKRWEELSSRFLRNNADALFFFSAAAFAYYLPAFMRATVIDFDRVDMVPDNVVLSLSPSLSQQTPAQFDSKIQHLAAAQRTAVCAFLEYLASQRTDFFPSQEPQTALREFWSRYRRTG